MLTSKKGFTLIEVAIALAILSGVIVTILTTLNYHLKATGRITGMATATQLAREKIEEFELTGLPIDKKGDFSPANPEYKWDYATEDLAFPGIKKVYLSVSWDKSEKITIETYRQDN